MNEYSDADLKRHTPIFYQYLVGLLSQEVSAEIRIPLMNILIRIGKLFGIIKLPDLPEKITFPSIEFKYLRE